MDIQLANMPFVVFDTETTGLSVRNGDAIIEIAGQKVVNGEVVTEFNELVNPGVVIDPRAMAMHGITNEIVMAKGKDLAEVIPAFIEFCRDCVLVGHNIIRFDLPFIKKHSEDLGLPPSRYKVIDTLPLARAKLVLKNYKLGTLATHFGVSYNGAHRALIDVDINRQVFIELMKL